MGREAGGWRGIFCIRLVKNVLRALRRHPGKAGRAVPLQDAGVRALGTRLRNRPRGAIGWRLGPPLKEMWAQSPPSYGGGGGTGHQATAFNSWLGPIVPVNVLRVEMRSVFLGLLVKIKATAQARFALNSPDALLRVL